MKRRWFRKSWLQGLKLTDQDLKVIERVKTFIGEMVDISETQFGFLRWFAARNNIVILRQLQEKYSANKDEFVLSLYKFVESVWSSTWGCYMVALTKLSIEAWLAMAVQLIYINAQSWFIVKGTLCDDFLVQVGLRQD